MSRQAMKNHILPDASSVLMTAKNAYQNDIWPKKTATDQSPRAPNGLNRNHKDVSDHGKQHYTSRTALHEDEDIDFDNN